MLEEVQALYDEIYNDLKEYLTTNSIYNPTVLKGIPEEKIFPIVIMTVLPYYSESTTLKYGDYKYDYGYEINIYAMQKGNIAKQTITNEISNLVEKFFKEEYRMTVTVTKDAPNEDTSVARDIVQAKCILDTKFKDKIVIYPA